MEKISVLVVDDEKDFLDTLIKRLQLRKIKAIGALNAKEALSLASQNNFDAIILDVKIPGEMDGIDLFHIFKKENPEIPIIFLSGHAAQEVSIDSIKQGAFDYMLKPTSLDEILKCLEKALSVSSPGEYYARQVL